MTNAVMPTCPIIDTHLHLWDPNVFHYPWLEKVTALNRPYSLEEYDAATEGYNVQAMVYVQCDVEPSASEREAAWVSDQARLDPRFQGIVAWAPLEQGHAVRATLERLTRHDLLCGIRRIIQFEPDLEFCLRSEFIEGVRTLEEFDLPFDICVDHRHLTNIVKFARQVPDVSLILDHMGKPAIKEGLLQPWATELRTLARFPNIVCKISGVATEADHQHWTSDQLKPYIETTIEAFGFDRILFGGDWPVSTQAIGFEQWVTLLDDILSGVDRSDKEKFWAHNATRIYGLTGSC